MKALVPVVLVVVVAVLVAPAFAGAPPQNLDVRTARGYYSYPFDRLTWMQDYATTMTRDGMHYIGSTGYRYIYYGGWLNWMNGFYEAKKRGAALPLDPLDFKQFPKLGAFFDTFFDLEVAGGYYMPNGDTSDTPKEGRRVYSVCFNYNPNLLSLSWKVSRDPRFAWVMVNVPGGERQLALFSDQEKQEIREAAATVKRNPFLDQKPRIMGGYGLAVLEDGADSDDYRFHRTMILHTGTSAGHHHCDALNLQIFAHGCRMTTEQGCRDDTGRNYPRVLSTYMKNVVDVQSEDWPPKWLVEHQKGEHVDTTMDEDDALWHNIGNYPGFGEAWPVTFKPLPDFMYVAGGAASQNHPELKLYQRQSAMITIDPGVPAKAPPSRPLYDVSTEHDPDAVTPSLYVFDVFRVAGGHTHTWCFHGCEADQFGVNVPVTKVGEDKKGPTRHNLKDCGSTVAEHWLRFHPVPENTIPEIPEKHEGKAGDAFEASWQLSRLNNPPGLTMRTSTEFRHEPAEAIWPQTMVFPMFKFNAERNQLGADYDPTAPRKVIKVTMLGHGGAHVMYGMGASRYAAYGMNLTYLYLQEPGETLDKQSVWPAIIEPYVGESKIKSARLLPVGGLAPNEDKDALRPVAILVETALGFTDVCFADGRPGRVRAVPEAGLDAVAAEEAYYSTDADGLRAATLVNGTRLSGKAGGIAVPAAERRGRITRVDYANQRFWVEGNWPDRALVGQEAFVESPNLAVPAPDGAMKWRDPGDGRRTSLNIREIKSEGNETMIEARRSVLMGKTTVLDVSEADGIVKVQNAATVLGTNPNRRRNMVYQNEAGTKTWRGEFLDGAWRRGSGCRYRLTGAPVAKGDFTDEDGDGLASLVCWDVGVGDVVRVPVHARLVRLEPGLYELRADTPVTITLQGKTARISVDGKAWRPLQSALAGGAATFTVGLDQLEGGRALVSVR